MNSLGAWSFDSLSASTAGLSDQCASVELDLDATVQVYQFGSLGADLKGQREEWWVFWVCELVEETGEEYFAISWGAAATPVPSAGDLTPDATKKDFGMARVARGEFMVRVPRLKPFGFFRLAGGASGGLLRACRVMPPPPPSASL